MDSKCASLDLIIDAADPKKGVHEILTAAKPTWDKSNVEIKTLSGGFSGAVFRVFQTDDPRDCLTVRCGNADPKYVELTNQGLENDVVQELTKHGCFPAVHAVYKNGYCFDFVHGKPVGSKGSSEMRLEENLIRSIGAEMAKYHAVSIPQLDYSTTKYFSMLNDFIQLDYTKWLDIIPEKEVLEKENKLVEEFCRKANSPFVLCHGDAQPANIIIREGTDNEVVFIDWEGVHIGPRAGDLAHSIYVVDFLASAFSIPKNAPQEEIHMRSLCESYLNTWNKVKKNGNKKQDTLEHLLNEVKTYKLIVTFKLACYMFIYPDLAKGFREDAETFVQEELDRYFDCKEKLLGVRGWG